MSRATLAKRLDLVPGNEPGRVYGLTLHRKRYVAYLTLAIPTWPRHREPRRSEVEEVMVYRDAPRQPWVATIAPQDDALLVFQPRGKRFDANTFAALCPGLRGAP